MKKNLLLISLIVIMLVLAFTAGAVSAKAQFDVLHVFMNSTDETYILWDCQMDITFNGDYGLILRCEQ